VVEKEGVDPWVGLKDPRVGLAYEGLELVGFLTTNTVSFEKGGKYKRKIDHLAATLPGFLLEKLKSFAGSFFASQITWVSMDKSVRKMDKIPVKRYKGEIYDRAWNKLQKKLHAVWAGTRETPSEEFIPGMNLKTSPGYKWSMFFKTKLETMTQEVFWEVMAEAPYSAPPIWKVSGKKEWLSKEDIDNDKVRTFIVPPLELLLWSKKFYYYQNQALKGFWWSAYGFNPYRGGVQTMALNLLKFNIFVSYDVRGWDRVLPHLKDVYRLRNRYYDNRVEWSRALEYVTENHCRSYLLLPLGDIVRRRCGNNSGSGNTTPDNIIAHMLILSYTLLKIYKDERILDVVPAYLFGDDNVMSLPEPPKGIIIESIIRETYLEFGLELDPYIESRNLEDHSFLGFRFGREKDVWKPYFMADKLISSFVYTIEKKNNDAASLSRMWTLTFMVGIKGGEEYETMVVALESIFESLSTSQDPVVRSLREAGPPDRDQIEHFVIGRECIFYGRLEEELLHLQWIDELTNSKRNRGGQKSL